jgi:hypothetical protein
MCRGTAPTWEAAAGLVGQRQRTRRAGEGDAEPATAAVVRRLVRSVAAYVAT